MAWYRGFPMGSNIPRKLRTSWAFRWGNAGRIYIQPRSRLSSLKDVVDQLQPCFVLLLASFNDLTVLEATQDGHDLHRLLIIRLASCIDALSRNSNHRFFCCDLPGFDRSCPDNLFFTRRNDQAMPSTICILDPSSTDLWERYNLIRDNLARVGQTTAKVPHEGLGRDVEAYKSPQASIHTFGDVPGWRIPRNIWVEKREDPRVPIQAARDQSLLPNTL